MVNNANATDNTTNPVVIPASIIALLLSSFMCLLLNIKNKKTSCPKTTSLTPFQSTHQLS